MALRHHFAVRNHQDNTRASIHSNRLDFKLYHGRVSKFIDLQIVFKRLRLRASTRIRTCCVFKSFHSGDRFQKFTVTVSIFMGYVWTLSVTATKCLQIQTNPDMCGRGPSPDGEIPLTTVGDSAFPSRPWLLKPYQEGTRVLVERHYNTGLSSARVVSEHTFGMLKGPWRILYKKNECALENIQIVVMTCILLHNICIAKKTLVTLDGD